MSEQDEQSPSDPAVARPTHDDPSVAPQVMAPATEAITPTAYSPSAPYPLASSAGQYPPRYDPAFALPPRPPRSRWIAPQHKVAATLIAIVAAVLLLGIGAVGGALVSHDGHGDGRDAYHSRTVTGPGGSHGQEGSR